MQKIIPVEDAVLRDTFWNAAIDLKKENEALKKRIKQLEDNRIVAAANGLANMLSYEDAVAKIKRLEEAGDALYENSYPTRWDLPEASARKLKEQEEWRKAKEAKP